MSCRRLGHHCAVMHCTLTTLCNAVPHPACCVRRGKLTAENTQPLLGVLQQLASLNLAGCVVEDSPQCFASLGQLSSLDLNSAAFVPAGVAAMEYLSLREELPAIYRSRLQAGLNSLAALTNLRRLALPNVALYPEHLASMGALHTLRELNIASCEDVNLRNGPACAELFSGLTNLTALQVSLHAIDFSYSSSDHQALRAKLFQDMPASLMALAALPLEALRVWQSKFPLKTAPYGIALKWHQMDVDDLAGTFGRYTAENSLDFQFPVTLKRAMVQAATMYQEPAPPLEFERVQATSFLELQL